MAVGEIANGVNQNAKNISKLDTKVNSTGALSAALAGLHTMQYDPLNPNQVMAAVGRYENKSAVAVGLSHHFNEKFMMTGAISVAEEHKVKSMMTLGFTYKFGSKEERERRHLPKEYDGKQMASIYMMQNEVYKERLRNQKQEAEIRELKALKAKESVSKIEKEKVKKQGVLIRKQAQEIEKLKVAQQKMNADNQKEKVKNQELERKLDDLLRRLEKLEGVGN